MIDIGVNLLHPQFDEDRPAVLARAREAGLDAMLLTVTDLNMLAAAIRLCEREGLACTAGVHPHDAKDAPADLEAKLREAAGERTVKAIGETG
ncbi:MAG: TatD family hydrolase, partial [Pseudomonadota bacterium]